MPNKHLRPEQSTLLLNKIVELSTKLSSLNQSTDLMTKEQLLVEATTFLSTFFSRIADPIFNPPSVQPDHTPNVEGYNQQFDQILSDLRILFAELENIETLMISNFNFIVSNSNRLMGRLKGVFSKLGDYILFSNDPNKDALYLSDSFNNLARIDSNSPLLNNAQCEIDQVQGIITLPVDNKQLRPIAVTETPVINNNSNGVPGNNYEANRGLNNDISIILDNNPDTWFEYEKVTTPANDDGTPLILDLVINLSDTKIINYIRINPNNFGVKVPVVIDSIETSIDGKSYISIKDEIPVAGFATIDEENVFALAPSTSKFAGQGVYSFTARKAKYVHLTFRQSVPYLIEDMNNGSTKLRYAIGIRDIEIAAIPYRPKGEIISTEYELDEVIKKVALVTNQAPSADSELVSIEHYVSPDNGSSWYQLMPKDFETISDVAKILNFNTLDNNSISTQAPIQKVRYKALLTRQSAAFSGPTSSLSKSIQRTVELHQSPEDIPYELELTGIPIPDTIKVMEPHFGSRGIDDVKYTVALGTNSKLNVDLPFKSIKLDPSKVWDGTKWTLKQTGPEEVHIGGELWTRGILSTAASEDKIYELDYEAGILRTGNNSSGKAVPGDATVELKFKPERLFVSNDITHSAGLDYMSDADQETFTIKRYGLQSIITEPLNKGTTMHRLAHGSLDNPSGVLCSDATLMVSYVVFQNGIDELTGTGQFSVDYTNGVIYTYDAAAVDSNTTVTYTYTPVTTLAKDEWTFTDNKTVSINDTSFTTLSVEDEDISLAVGAIYTNLANMAIVNGSIRLSGVGATDFKREVKFVDGRQELNDYIKVADKIPAITSTGNTTFSFRLKIVDDSTYQVSFSNLDLFQTEVGVTPSSPGEYQIDRSIGTVTVRTDTTWSNAGSVTYYYGDPTKNNDGWYSINYNTGEIHTVTPIVSPTYASYQYTDYRASYFIAREINDNDFTFDVTSNTLTLQGREILQKQRLQGPIQNNNYQVTFDQVVQNRENISDLEPYFTPVLKDYALKVVPESSLL